MTTSTVRHRDRGPAVALDSNVKALGLVALMACLAACSSGWDVRPLGVELLKKEQAFETAGSKVAAKGYLEFTFQTSADLVDYARQRDANLWYEARACNSSVQLQGWPAIYDTSPPGSAERTYAILIAYREHGYDLGKQADDVCVRFGAGSMNPVDYARSNELRVAIPEALRTQLREYDVGHDEPWIHLDPSCRDRMCLLNLHPGSGG